MYLSKTATTVILFEEKVHVQRIQSQITFHSFHSPETEYVSFEKKLHNLTMPGVI